MKKILLLLLSLLPLQALMAQPAVVADAALRSDVKSVELYCPGAELEFPVLTLGGSARLTLEFDVLGTQAEQLRWRLVHCDRYWRPDALEPSEFMNGFETGAVEGYDFSFTTLRDYVHYRTTLPDGFAEFVHSGNYAVLVSPDDAPDSLLLMRRFCVVEGGAKADVQLTRPYDGIDIERRQEVDVLVLPQNPAVGDPQYLTVTVQQNGRTDNRRTLEFSGYDGAALAFRHRQANIFAAGNTFRYFDCSNLRAAIYNVLRVEDYGGEQFVMLHPEEDRSRKHYLSETTLNGGMKVNIWDRENPDLEADYVWVNFSLPMAQPMLDGTVHIVGALTDWQLDERSAMEYNPRYRAYTKRLLLKQGYYAYQLLVKRGGAGEGETRQLEGDHREMPNRYTVAVYQHGPADRADRLLTIVSVGR